MDICYASFINASLCYVGCIMKMEPTAFISSFLFWLNVISGCDYDISWRVSIILYLNRAIEEIGFSISGFLLLSFRGYGCICNRFYALCYFFSLDIQVVYFELD